MTAWIFTGVTAFVVLLIILAEIRCGRRSKEFLKGINPEIDALTNSVTAKYRAKYGKDPTLPFSTVEPPRRRFFRR